VTSDVKRNAFLLAGGLVCNSGMFQLAAALSSLTLVAVTGVTGILGLGPAIFLASGAIVVGPAGRLLDQALEQLFAVQQPRAALLEILQQVVDGAAELAQ